MQGHSRSETQPNQYHRLQSTRGMERHVGVHLQQRGDQSHRHDCPSCVPKEAQTSGEAGAHGVQVCLPSSAAPAFTEGPMGNFSSTANGKDQELLSLAI